MKKKSWQALAALFFLLFLVFAPMTYYWYEKVTKLRSEGKVEEATVINHEVKRSTNKHRTKSHYLVVNFFADKPGEKKPNPKPTKEPKNDDTVSRILGGLDRTLSNIRNRKYTKAQIAVSKGDLEKYPVGSKVKIVYLPEDPQGAMLQSRVKEFDFTIYLALSSACLTLAMIGLVFSRRAA